MLCNSTYKASAWYTLWSLTAFLSKVTIEPKHNRPVYPNIPTVSKHVGGCFIPLGFSQYANSGEWRGIAWSPLINCFHQLHFLCMGIEVKVLCLFLKFEHNYAFIANTFSLGGLFCSCILIFQDSYVWNVLFKLGKVDKSICLAICKPRYL